jgi:hypothetical protein
MLPNALCIVHHSLNISINAQEGKAMKLLDVEDSLLLD